MSQPKPRSFRIPTALIDSGSNRLRRELRRLFISFRRGHITRETCVRSGEDAISENYLAQVMRVRDYVHRKRLDFPDDAEELTQLREAKEEALTRWRGISVDM